MTGSRISSRRPLLSRTAMSHKVCGTFIAGIFAMLAMCGTSGLAQSSTPLPTAINFGSVAAGSYSTAQTVVFTFTASATLGSTPYGVFTQGTQVLDFRASSSQGGSACAASRTYSIGNSCTVQVVFQPARPGLSLGAVQLLDSNLTPLGTATFSGTGTGPMLTFPSVTPTTVYKGAPLHVAVDRSGDLFIAESASSSGNGVVKVFIATQGVIPSVAKPVTIASNFGIISGIAVDGAGNIFVADNGTGSVKEIVAVDGSYITNPSIVTVYTGTPRSVTFDAAGNLLIADASSVKRLAPVSGVISSASPVTTIASGFNNPSGLAVSPAGDVYVSDTGNSALKQIVAAGGTVTPTSTITTIGSFAAQDLAVDAAGDLYIAFHAGSRILEGVAVNGVLAASPNYLLVDGYATIYPTGIAVSSRGDIYFADDTANTVSRLDQGDPPTLTFASTQPPATSTDSPQKLTLANVGNVPLVFSIPTTASNPSTPVDFTIAGSTACPVLTTASATATTLAPGAQCTQSVSFKPTVAGPIAETGTYTDNSLNVTSATQSVSLSGFGYGNLAITAISPPLFGFSTTYVGSNYGYDAVAFLYNLSATAIQLPTPTLTDTTNFSATDNCNGTIAANSSCRVAFTFHPTAPGTFTATYTVADPANPTAPASLTFSAVAIAAPVDSRGKYTVQVFPVADGRPNGIAVDRSNNVYLPVYISGSGVLLDALPAVNGAETLSQPTQRIAAGTQETQGVTTDDQGNVYLVDQGSTGYEVRELLAVNGSVPTNPVASILFHTTSSGSYSAELNANIAVDHKGDVFFEDFVDGYPSAYEYLYELVAVAGAVPPVNPTIVTLAQTYTQTGGVGTQSSQNFIQQLAVDSTNDVFYAYEADDLYELAAVNGNLPANLMAQKLHGGPLGDRYPGPFVVDPNGNVIYSYVASTAGGSVEQILELTAVNGVLPTYPEVQILYSSPFSGFNATGIALDQAGNILIADSTGSDVIRLTPGVTPTGSLSVAPATQTFPSTVAGQASPVQTSTISNTTSSAIYLSSGSLTDATDFTQTDNCSGLISAGGACTVTFTFTPRSTGSLTSTYSIHDLNNPGAPLTVVLTGNGTGTLTIAPVTQLFSATTVNNTSSSLASTITNNTSSIAYLGNATLTDATNFTQTDNCNGTVTNGGGTCTVTFTFTPKATGMLNSTYAIAAATYTNSPLGTLTVALTGTGIPAAIPQAAFSPTALTYSTVVNTAAYNQSTTLTNAGTGSLAISSLAMSGANASSFTIVTNTCGSSLAAGASCAVTVGFTAITLGSYSATLTATDNASSTKQTVALTGTVSGTPVASLTPTSLTFSATANTSSATQTATLTNTGNAPLTISSVALTGTSAPLFVDLSACGTSLAAGANCTIAVGFDPTAAGSFTASLVVTDNSGSSTSATSTSVSQSVALSGAGTPAPLPQASLTPATYTFGSIPSGTSGTAATFTLSNTGSVSVPVSSVTLTGANAGSFTIVRSLCDITLATGSSCIVTVNFLPTTVGTFSATLNINDSAGTQTVALSGTATSPVTPDFTISATPAAQSSYRGQTATYTIQLASLLTGNPFTGNITLAASGLPSGATATFTPATVVPGAQGADTVLSVSIPSFSGANRTPSRWPTAPTSTGLSLALLLGGLGFRRRHRKLRVPALLTALGLLALATSVTGCGSGNGFATPTSTSTITITGTSGSSVHTTTVTLTVQ